MTISDPGAAESDQPGFAVSIVTGKLCVVEVGCELDMATAQSLEALLTRALIGGYSGVLVELSKCDFLGSAGLAVLMAAQNQASTLGTRFALAGLNRVVRRALDATGLTPLLTIYPTAEEAVPGLGADATR